MTRSSRSPFSSLAIAGALVAIVVAATRAESTPPPPAARAAEFTPSSTRVDALAPTFVVTPAPSPPI